MGRQGPRAQALDPQAALRQQAPRSLTNHPFAANGQRTPDSGAPSKLRLGGIRAIGYWLFAIGYLLLAIGYWLFATAYCLLPTGYWLLAIGYCLLATAYFIPSAAEGSAFAFRQTAAATLKIVACPCSATTRNKNYWLLATAYWLLPTPCTSHPRVKGTGFSPYIRPSHFSRKKPTRRSRARPPLAMPSPWSYLCDLR
jgi:hypothetical protein